MDGPLSASVVIPTYNRSAHLRRTLASLRRQDLPGSAFDVVVADDGSSDDTRAVVEEFGVRYVFQRDEGYRVAAARNAGARVAKGEALIFLDSGALAGPGFVRAHLAALRSAPVPRALIGYTYGYDPWGPVGRLPDLLDCSPAEIVRQLGSDPAFRDRRHARLTAAGGLDRLHAPWTLFWTVNVALTARDFHAVGGFDEDFRCWGGEDTELGYRLATAGVSLAAAPAAWAVESPHERDLRAMDAGTVRNAMLVWSKHPTPMTELYWGIYGHVEHQMSLETEYEAYLRWRTATEGVRVADEVDAAVAASGVERVVRSGGSVLVVGADRGFRPRPGWSALCPEGGPDPAVEKAIGLRTTHPDQCFDLVVLTSRLTGLWPRWGRLLHREAKRIGRSVTASAALRPALAGSGAERVGGSRRDQV